MKDLIERSRLEKAHVAIRTVFNVDMPDEISVLTGGGSSAKMYKLKVNNQYYVLRVMGLDQPIQDREIQIACAKYGTKLNVAPHCYYADADDGIIIMDFINKVPLPKEIVLQKMPKLLSKLHYSEKISPPFCVIFPYMKDLIAKAIEITPSEQLVDYYHSIQKIMAILSRHRQLASCHNDLNSENILYDGKQIYLIDFEAAGLEDPYFDLATVCVQNCFDTHQERAFMEDYLQRKPKKIEMAKLALMKQIAYCYYALHFFQHAYTAGMMEFHDSVPTFKQWYQGRKEGKYSYDTTYDLMLYAMVVLNQSLEEMSKPEFIEATRLLEESPHILDDAVKKS